MREWWLVHTKPRQEEKALANLRAQGFECYLPLLPVEVLQRGSLKVKDQPLFPRYLFARPSINGACENWGVIRSTLGVNRLVSFGTQPAKVSEALVCAIQESTAQRIEPQAKFNQGDVLHITQGPFAGIEAIYDMAEGEGRVIVLINLISKQARLPISPAYLKKA